MSNKKTSSNGTSEKEKSPLVLLRESTTFKDTLILLAWITSILIIANVCWYTTQGLRDRLTIRAVNRVFIQTGDSRRLLEPTSPEWKASLLTGTWFTMQDETPVRKKALVFSFIGEGTFFPCIAVMTQDGKVADIIPLSSHGEKVLKRISPGILRLYTKRIEGAET